MIAPLTNHLWQSTLFAVAAALLAFALRRNRAGVRHALWMTASVKFFLPFSLLIGLGSALAPASTSGTSIEPQAPGTMVVAVDQITQPFDDVFVETAAPAPESPSSGLVRWPQIALVVWAAGFFGIAMFRLVAWRRIRAAVRVSAPIELPSGAVQMKIRSTPDVLEPGVVGLFRPVLLLPAGIQEYLTPSQLQAVIEHELCHVRRHDNLTAAVHMVVEGIFWFHPLVWWIGARLLDERERACDEHVLATVAEPNAYAEGILGVCKRYVESPIACVSGVTGSDLKKRIADIINGRVGARLTLARRVILLAAAITAIVLPFFAGLATAPLRAAAGQDAEALKAKFEVVSIKPCPGIAARPPAPRTGMRSGGAPWDAQTTPGYVYWDCATLAQLVDQAYADKDHPLQNSAIVRRLPSSPSQAPKRVRGGPSWAESEMFTIEAKAPINLTEEALTGASNRTLVLLPAAMSQALRAMLEDRFQLKVRRETEQQDMYALTVAKGGLNRERITSPKPGDCMTPSTYSAMPPEERPQRPTLCGRAEMTMDRGQIYSSFTMRQLAELLSTSPLDRFVVDQTGIDGPFNFVLLPDRSGEGSSESFYTRALEALGLKLVAIKGPGEYIQIERAERPRPDWPDSANVGPANAPARAQGAGPAVQQPDGSGDELPRAASRPQAPAMAIKFDVVSIKPCLTDAPSNGRGGSTSMRFSISPGYVHCGCVSLAELVEIAWSGPFPVNTLLNTQRLPPDSRPDLPERVRGGSSWVRDERFEVEISLSGDVSNLTGSARHDQVTLAMRPALQVMLADRFQLKLRKATEERTMYAMTVAKGGLKITQTATSAERCWTIPPDTPRGAQPVAPPGFENAPPCRYSMNAGNKAGNKFWDIKYIGLRDFAKVLSETVDRYVLDQTGVDARFSFRLEYTSDDRTPGDTYDPFARIRAERGALPQPPGTAPSIFQALEALGLRLDPTKGPAEYFLIESAQRPKPNFP